MTINLILSPRPRVALLALTLAACSGDSGTTGTASESGTSDPSTSGTTFGESSTSVGTTDPTSVSVSVSVSTSVSTTGSTSVGPGTDASVTATATDSTASMTTDPTGGPESTSDATTGPDPTTGFNPCDDVPVQGDAGDECQIDCECRPITNIEPSGPLAQWMIEYGPNGEGACVVVPLIGGLCGECKSADDCPDGGCTLPNPLLSWPSYCNDGSAGDGCDADGPNTCQPGLECGTVIDAAGILTVSTCGECASSADCPNPKPYCAPAYDIPKFSGELSCVGAGSLPLDVGCTIGEDDACASGVCSVAVLMGVIQLGVCGECDGDNDCGPGEQCEDAWVNLDNLPPDPDNPPPNYQPVMGSRCV